jgi:heme exporter protein B
VVAMLRDAWLVARRDLRIEVRSRVVLWQVVPFALLVLLLFAFAFGPSAARLAASAPGLFWLALLFSTILFAQRSRALEGSEATREGAKLLGLDPSGVFLGKMAALIVQLIALEMVLMAGILLFFHVAVVTWWVLVASGLLAALGLASASVLYGAVSGEARIRATLLPVLLLPILAPVLIAGVRAFSAALEKSGGLGGRWLGVLAVFGIVYCALGIALYGSLEEN